jgi:Intrinsic membrane protein PufX
MSDKYYTEKDTTSALRSWVMWQMLRGMGWAALFVLAIGLVLGGIWAVGQVLPAESKTAPSPYGQMITAPAALVDLA